MDSLHQQSMLLLARVVMKHDTSFADKVANMEQARLTNDEILQLQEIVGAEFCDIGLNDDDEPNSIGLTLESIIDWLGRQRHGD